MTPRGRFGKSLDRGRGVHGAKWCYITPAGEMIDYTAVKKATVSSTSPADKGWILFKSRKEARRWLGLVEMQAAGEIRGLRRQVKLDLHVRNPQGLMVRIGGYVVDHVYERLDRYSTGGGERVWGLVYEEVKGYREDVYLWKKKHVEAEYGFTIEEV